MQAPLWAAYRSPQTPQHPQMQQSHLSGETCGWTPRRSRLLCQPGSFTHQELLTALLPCGLSADMLVGLALR